MTRIAIIGATSGIAKEAAKLWLARASHSGHPLELFLVGRNAEALEALAQDYRIRNPIAMVRVIASELTDPDTISRIVHETVGDGERPLDVALIAHGAMLSGDQLEQDAGTVAENLRVNAVSPVLFAQGYAQQFVRQGGGIIAIIGSVAGDRGRRVNYVYGAGKGLIERFVQGLQHRLVDTPVRVVLLKPGPTATAMTADRQAEGEKLVPADVVASGLVRAVDQRKPVAYLPGRWRIIMLVVRLIPRVLFHRTNF